MDIGFGMEEAIEEAKAENEAAIEANKRGDSAGYVSALSRRDYFLREAALSYKAREKLPSSSFAFPENRGYPIHDKAHASNALARASGKPEYATVKKKVCARYPDLPSCKTED